MARLSASERAKLPDTAFAYIDSRGERRLPINDAAHVRNALARFDQVSFEHDTARERARERLLLAARRHGIVPVGFITGQLRSARKQAAAGRMVIELGRIETTNELEEELRGALGDPSLALLRWSRATGNSEPGPMAWMFGFGPEFTAETSLSPRADTSVSRSIPRRG